MATGAYYTAGAVVGKTEVDVFVPELWSDEVLAQYKANLVLGNLVTRMNHQGRKGDTIHVPAPYRGSAYSKSENVAVTLQNNTEEQVNISIDQHWEYSRLIEDFASVQALGSARAFYTADAGYQMAKTVDQFMALQMHRFNTGDMTAATFDQTAWETGVIGSDGSTAFSSASSGNGAALTDAGLRRAIQTLDDNDVPMADRVLVIPPVEKKSLTGIPRFTEQAFVGEVGAANTIRNGLIGDLYGVRVYVSSNLPVIHCNSVTNESTTDFSTSDATTAYGTAEGGAFGDFGFSTDTQNWDASTPTDTQYRACGLFHKSALVYVEQMGVRAQTQYKQEYLADLFTADCIFGGMGLRTGAASSGQTDTAGLSIIVPA
jgi:N4-gp56 family major capsid protein